MDVCSGSHPLRQVAYRSLKRTWHFHQRLILHYMQSSTMGNLLYRKAAATSLQLLSTSATNKTTALSKVLGELWDCWSPSALRRWMIAGPELTRITSEFEKSEISRDMHVQITRHHDQLPSIQHTFVKELKNFDGNNFCNGESIS